MCESPNPTAPAISPPAVGIRPSVKRFFWIHAIAGLLVWSIGILSIAFVTGGVVALAAIPIAVVCFAPIVLLVAVIHAHLMSFQVTRDGIEATWRRLPLPWKNIGSVHSLFPLFIVLLRSERSWIDLTMFRRT